MNAKGKKPTLKQRIMLDRLGYHPDMYLIVKDTPESITIKSIRRGDRKEVAK